MLPSHMPLLFSLDATLQRVAVTRTTQVILEQRASNDHQRGPSRIVSLILHVFISCWDSHCFRIPSFVFVGCISFVMYVRSLRWTNSSGSLLLHASFIHSILCRNSSLHRLLHQAIRSREVCRNTRRDEYSTSKGGRPPRYAGL